LEKIGMIGTGAMGLALLQRLNAKRRQGRLL
jgi:pyrroline-5-carboxylate reductase